MRKALIVAMLLVLAAGAWTAAPLIAAWQIREAVRTGDVATLEARVDWLAVRRSLKTSLAESRLAIQELADIAGEPRPSFWQRVKIAALPYLSDPLIDRYVTAKGAPRLYEWRQEWRKRVGPPRTSGGAAQAGLWAALPGAGRMAGVRNVESAGFVSPMRVEIRLVDRYRPGRRWVAALELAAFGWKLTEMRVVTVPAERPVRTTRS